MPAHETAHAQSGVYSLIFMCAAAVTCMLSGKTIAAFSSLQGDNAIEPTTANYTYKHILEVQNTVYEIGLGPSQLKEVRAWHICIHAASFTMA
jgi:hypothetical protein